MLKKACLNLFLLVISLTFFASGASAATFYLSPATSNVGQGGTFTVQLKIDTQGQPINAVDVHMSYPQDKLEVVSINQSSTFRTAAGKNVQNGGIHLELAGVNPDNGQLTIANGNVTVATLTFRAKTIGAAKVDIGGNSVALSQSDGTNKITSVKGASFNVVAATPKPSAAAQAINVSDVQVSNIATNGATISWKTDKKSDSMVDYGLTTQYTGQQSKNESVTDHSITISDSTVLPGSLLHYKVTSKDAAGVIGSSSDAVIHLVGYTVKIKLVDNSGAPLPNTKLSLFTDPPMEGTTDAQGESTFKDVTPEKLVVNVKGKGFERSADIDVKPDPDFDKVQEFTITVDASGLSELSQKQSTKFLGLDLMVWGLLGAVFVIGLIIIIIYVKKKGSSGPKPPSAESPDPSPPAPNPYTAESSQPTVYSSK